MFSSRLPELLAPNAFSLLLAERRAAGATLLDLTQTNPTDAGLTYPSQLLSAFASPSIMHYRPHPLGAPDARDAVAADYVRQRTPIAADRIVLTASTSESYSLLFKLLCNPGEAVLVPQPSYPLFALLTSLDGVEARPYRLEYHGVWSIDRASLEEALSTTTRAILIVSPNNPTGSMLRAADRDWLVELCVSRGIALIADEVFADYPLSPKSDAVRVAGETRALTFSLGGLSKAVGLPQMKLGWMAVSGPDHAVRAALDRLEVMCDTYLSVSTPVQAAAADLLSSGAAVRVAIQARLADNLAALTRAVSEFPAIRILPPEGGWSTVLQVPAHQSEEALVLRLLDAGVVVHPGYFYDFDREAFVVISLLPAADVFSRAIDRLLPIAAGATP